MKAYLRWIDQQVINDFKHHYESTDKYGTKNTGLLFKWDKDDLLLDNTNVLRYRVRGVGISHLMPHFAFNIKLGEKIGWVRKDWRGEWELDAYLQIIYHDDKMPTKGQRFSGCQWKPTLLHYCERS